VPGRTRDSTTVSACAFLVKRRPDHQHTSKKKKGQDKESKENSKSREVGTSFEGSNQDSAKKGSNQQS